MTTKKLPPYGAIDSKAAAVEIGISYHRLMRNCREGIARPRTWRGTPRTPVWWMPLDIKMMKCGDTIRRLFPLPDQARRVYEYTQPLFVDGYIPRARGRSFADDTILILSKEILLHDFIATPVSVSFRKPGDPKSLMSMNRITAYIVIIPSRLLRH